MDDGPLVHFLAFVKNSWELFVSHVPIYVFPAILLHREKLFKSWVTRVNSLLHAARVVV